MHSPAIAAFVAAFAQKQLGFELELRANGTHAAHFRPRLCGNALTMGVSEWNMTIQTATRIGV